MSRYEEFIRLHEAMSVRPKVRAGRLWGSGIAVAAVVALLMVCGVGLVRGGLLVPAPVFVPEGASVAVAAFTTGLWAMVAVLQATGLLHVLLLIAEHPIRGFVGIGAMAVTLAALLPLTLRVPPDAAMATGALNLVGGLTAIGLLYLVAGACVRWPEPPRRRRRRLWDG